MKKAERALREAARMARLGERKRQLLESVPAVVHARSLLYVGANAKRMEMLDLFMGNGCDIDILEAWPENVAGLVRWNRKRRAFNAVILGDVTALSATRLYDTVMWWHGPEHIPSDLLGETLRRVEQAATRLVVLASPWGDVTQGEAYGNPYERHRFGLSVDDYARRGYFTNTIGKKDTLGSNLLAWKAVEP